MEFSDALQLREIIIGPRCKTKISQILQIVSPHIKNITIIKAQLAFKSYSVVINNRFKQLHT